MQKTNYWLNFFFNFEPPGSFVNEGKIVVSKPEVNTFIDSGLVWHIVNGQCSHTMNIDSIISERMNLICARLLYYIIRSLSLDGFRHCLHCNTFEASEKHNRHAMQWTISILLNKAQMMIGKKLSNPKWLIVAYTYTMGEKDDNVHYLSSVRRLTLCNVN